MSDNRQNGKSRMLFVQVPQGSFFRVVAAPTKRFQKVRHGISVDKDYKMLQFKIDVLCVIDEGKKR